MKNRSFNMNPQFRFSWRMLGVVLLLILFLFLVSSGYTQIPGTHIGVAENQFTGNYFTVEPGLHFWPLDPRIVPFAVTVTKYDLRRQIIEIGAEPADTELVADFRPVHFAHVVESATAQPDPVIGAEVVVEEKYEVHVTGPLVPHSGNASQPPAQPIR